jgi:glutamine synthetase
VATSPCPRSTTSPTSATTCASRWIEVGLQVERSHHEVGTGGQQEINYKFNTLLHAATT